MGVLTKRRWASIALLSVVLPVSLLVTFRLTGLLPEPETPETVTVDAICWNMSRPSDDDILVDEWANNSHVDDGVTVGFGVHILEFYVHDPLAWGHDYLLLRVVATAEVDDGFVQSVIMKISASDSYAFLGILEDPNFMKLCNAELSDIHDFGAGELKAHLKASCINQPKNSSLSITSYWIFVEKQNMDHFITVSLEITYFDGTTYRRLEVPINLGMLAR